MKENRSVHVLHKLNTAPGESNRLAVGKTFQFPNSRDRYTVRENGAVVNADPKPYRNKAERKKYKQLRRQRRLENESCSS